MVCTLANTAEGLTPSVRPGVSGLAAAVIIVSLFGVSASDDCQTKMGTGLSCVQGKVLSVGQVT